MKTTRVAPLAFVLAGAVACGDSGDSPYSFGGGGLAGSSEPEASSEFAWHGEDRAQIEAAAVEGLQKAKQLLSAGFESFNISEASELERLELESPLPVYAMLPEAIDAFAASTLVADVVTPNASFYFPVSVDGRVRFFIDVNCREKRSWKASNIGFAGLADGVDAALRRYRGTGASLKMLFDADSRAAVVLAQQSNGAETLFAASGSRALAAVTRNGGEVEASDLFAVLRE
jgi:hypothetical protein